MYSSLSPKFTGRKVHFTDLIIEQLPEVTTMTLRTFIALLLMYMLGVAPFAADRPAVGSVAKDITLETQDNRAADAAAIRTHIESIFQAFIDGDIDKIYATHSEDWRGILEGSQVPIKGI